MTRVVQWLVVALTACLAVRLLAWLITPILPWLAVLLVVAGLVAIVTAVHRL